MRKVMVLVLCLSLVAGLALAREMVLTPIDQQRIDIYPGDLFGARSEDPDCHLGKIFTGFDDFGGWYGTFWEGYEDYAYRINRVNQNPCLCTDGWALRNVIMSLVLREGTVLEMQPALFSGAAAAPPTALLYEGPQYTVNFPIPDEDHDPNALWIVTFTLDFVTDLGDPRDCQIPPGGDFFLVMRFLDGGENSPTYPYYPGDPTDEFFVGLPVDDAPVANQQYVNFGTGWLDISGLVGKLYMSAEIDCCSEGVSTEESSLSNIKKLFR